MRPEGVLTMPSGQPQEPDEPMAGIIDKFLPESIAEVLRHRTVADGKVTWEFENVTVTYKERTE